MSGVSQLIPKSIKRAIFFQLSTVLNPSLIFLEVKLLSAFHMFSSVLVSVIEMLFVDAFH